MYNKRHLTVPLVAVDKRINICRIKGGLGGNENKNERRLQ